jgi:hypothetical protein
VLQAAVVVKTAQISADKRMLVARNLKRMMVTAMIMIAHALTAMKAHAARLCHRRRRGRRSVET